VVAPSGPIDRDELERGLAVLRERFGLRVRVRADVTTRRGYLAGEDARRIEEWREAVADREARAIFFARGGYGAMRLLPAIDPAALTAEPKWVVGFSDATALHAALNQAGLVTVHGPMVSTLGRSTPASLDHLHALLFGSAEPAQPSAGPSASTPAADGMEPGAGCLGAAVIRPGLATGTLLGGSLCLLAHLCGTPWALRLRGAILFLEDIDEKPYRLDRYLTQLRLSGVLDGVGGVCVGQLTACDHGGESGSATVRALVSELGVPAIEGIAAGHEEPNLALPLGATVTLIAPTAREDARPRLRFDEVRWA
jgi:muramoyltetrapeptide carboxypeptidase